MADENTAKPGAEPGNKEDGETAEPAGAEPAAKDAKSDSSTETVPFDKDPRWKSARLAEKKLQALLKANELDDPDDLADLVQRGKMVKGKLRDLNDLDSIIQDAEEIRKYRPYWQAEAERKRRETEDPETRADRAEQELAAIRTEKQRREYLKKQAEDDMRSIADYNNGIKELADDLDIPKEDRSLFLEYCGVNNSANEIDIRDPKARKKLAAEAKTKIEAFKQSVIAEYLKGKDQTPKVGSAQTGAPELNKPKLMLRDGSSKRAFLERLRAAAGG